jgi:diadenosine tetraphosphate (Ap4A) HIT family hydrolase
VPSIFTRIIDGEIPGRFVWRDDRCVAFLTIAPLTPGHTLVVPIEEIDRWTDLPVDLAAHVFTVAHAIGQAVQSGFRPARVGLLIAGMEVPHAHVHVLPMNRESDLHFANADPDPAPEDLDAAADTIRRELRALGFTPA